MKKLPTAMMENKDLPEEEIQNKEIPVESDIVKEEPDETPKLDIVPNETSQKEETPEKSPEVTETPTESPEKTEKPSDVPEENCVMVGGNKIEIKPTKLKYFRNKAASAYGVIKAVPIHELLTYEAGILDANRDADALLYDFLVAAFDDPDLVRDNYNEMDADTVEKVVQIFGRLNHIDEKQDALRKNKEAQAKP